MLDFMKTLTGHPQTFIYTIKNFEAHIFTDI